MNPDRFLGPNLSISKELYQEIKDLPLICPHGHVDPRLLADENYTFPDPVALFIRPDHYLLRMLYSQGVDLKFFLDVEQDPREVWCKFAEHYHLFWGTPSGVWLDYQLSDTFGIPAKLTPKTAENIYDILVSKLKEPDYTPRALFERFRIEVLCTTDGATDSLDHHRKIKNDEWPGRVLPTFRPDALVSFGDPKWPQELAKLQNLVSTNVSTWKGFLDGIRERRKVFKDLGCLATDHGCEIPFTEHLSSAQAEGLFDEALRAKLPAYDHRRLQGHMLIEMAAMSCEDGMVMQLHSGSHRNHNNLIFERYGPDMGCDIPRNVDFTQGLKPLLNAFGNDPKFRLIVFTLDESTYSRELAPMAGHYPALRLGPPWWFHDSLNGMKRYFDQVMETAGVYNTVGFNDDTRAFCSIPARHDLWRRASCRWLSELVGDGVVTAGQASVLAKELAVGRARDGYGLG